MVVGSLLGRRARLFPRACMTYSPHEGGGFRFPLFLLQLCSLRLHSEEHEHARRPAGPVAIPLSPRYLHDLQSLQMAAVIEWVPRQHVSSRATRLQYVSESLQLLTGHSWMQAR